MRVLVDTSVWSLALRRGSDVASSQVLELRELIAELRVEMIGAIRQELLSGIRIKGQFDKLREHLQAFPDLVLGRDDYERAAEFFNICRGKGVQGSNIDFLICAAAANRSLTIFTADQDFTHFRQHLPIRLHELRTGL